MEYMIVKYYSKIRSYELHFVTGVSSSNKKLLLDEKFLI